MNESNKTTNRAAEVAHQIYATVEGRAYPSARLQWRTSYWEFASPAKARAALGELIMHQLDKGEAEGLALWEEAFDKGQPLDPPGGYPELRFHDAREARSPRGMRIMPRRRHGLFSDPLEDRGWQVVEIAPALPCGWAPTAEFIGHLPACLRYAARTYALDLDSEIITCQGLDRPMLKALAGALR